jgi:hypothetical protein
MTLKTLRLMSLFLLLALTLALIGYGLMRWVELEAAKANNYNIFVRTGYEVSEPVLEVR